jgi:2-oxoglutarate dehydrogenase E1 component
MPAFSDDFLSFLTADNAVYVDSLYTAYLQDPNAVSPEWQAYFSQMAPSLEASSISGADVDSQTILASVQATKLIDAYRGLGHKLAQLDPLNLAQKIIPPELSPQTYGFAGKNDGERVFVEEKGALSSTTVRDLIARFDRIYGGSIGVEFAHIENQEQRLWLQSHMEGGEGILPLVQRTLSSEDQKQVLKKLLETEGIEQFLNKKYPASTRFGIDGAESLMPGIEEVLIQSARVGVEEVIIGMPHRGRLNVLTSTLEKPIQAIFTEFREEEFYLSSLKESGDVKYHLGASTDRIFDGKKVHLSLMPNPSHLEAVDPVVLGKIRAYQDEIKDTDRSKVMGLLLHGDAAFEGQGIVAETFMMSHLKGYETGGTFHIVVNNQIGFTTNPEDGRSSPYCSDLALVVQAPVFHVNGDDPDAVINVVRVAALYRHVFKSDVVIDLVCYRRFGHNEGDEPGFTQPRMVKAISAQSSVAELYSQKLVGTGVTSEKEILTLRENLRATLQKNFEAAATYAPPKDQKLGRSWTGLRFKQEKEVHQATGVEKKVLVEMGAALSKIPKDFHLHPKLGRFFDARKKMVEGTEPVDWSMAEALAFGSLLWEGYPVRLSGQDSARGTFSQRHAVLRDMETEEKHICFNMLSKSQASFEVWDSPLAEASVVGFEMGYSLAAPKTLVLWEAQYGDFSNGAQVIIDQFISSTEVKWLRMSGLVMLLPHAYEGQGPEHSSARLERYLQLCAEDNLQVINCTTPANYFHGLRRQIHRDYRKPLVIVTPKSLLRRKYMISSLKEFEKGTSFQEVIPDSLSSAKRVILCSGKIYYDLWEAREAQKIKDTALVRLEQFYPFPHDLLVKALRPYKGAEVVWCQEEPKNMGAWTFLDRRLEAALEEAKMKNTRPFYVGRSEAASPATGLSARHHREQGAILQEALGLKKVK